MWAPLCKVESRIIAGGIHHPGLLLEFSPVFSTVVKVVVSPVCGGFRNVTHPTLQQLNACFFKHAEIFGK